ncbi:flagellar protein FlgN [Gorillibacterium timonense]|uniref:flagellar protein FlgN n=1 Tax=Gorillibacterium timonense TaxID=1689269 RepID=UPI00071D4332|nr:flagellar protein FlgN [Gorillibacterium timonense]
MSIQALREEMEQLIHLHDGLLELSAAKTQVLVENNVEELNRIVHKEASLVRQVTECERRRMEAIDRFLISKGFHPTPAITVSEVIRLIFRMEDKQAVQHLQQGLADRLEKLKRLNEQNRQLIEQSLGYLNLSLDLVIGPPEDDTVYRNPHQQNAAGYRNRFYDNRV